MYENKKQKSSIQSSKDALEFCLPILKGIADWSESALHDALIEKIAAAGYKNGTVLWPLRIAISGQMSTPGGAIEIAWLIGRDETLRRVRDGLARLESGK
jgi:glutamyl-tRNA synthetase